MTPIINSKYKNNIAPSGSMIFGTASQCYDGNDDDNDDGDDDEYVMLDVV